MTIDRDSLEPGEQLLWSGGPDPKAYTDRYSRFGFGLGLILMAIGVLLFAYGQAASIDTIRLMLAPLLFLIAVVLLVIPLRHRRHAQYTRYGVTDRRAIIEIPGLLLRNRVSVPLDEIRRIEVKPPGDLLFRDCVGQSENGLYFIRDGFLALANVHVAEQVLRTTVDRFRAQAHPL